jgi:PAS domain S-box-containing protein
MDTLKSKTSLLTKIIDVGVLDPEDTRRRLLSILLLTMAIIAASMLVTALVAAPLALAGRPQEVLGLLLSAGLTLLGVAILYGVNRYVSGMLASAIFVLLLIVLAAVADEPRQVVDGHGLAMFAPPILMASVLLQPWTTFVAAALSSLVIVVIGRFVLGQTIPNLPGMSIFVVLALVAYLSSSSLQRTLERLHAANAALQESETKYRYLFENVPISLWEEDFSAVKTYLDELREQGVEDLQAYLEGYPDAVAHCLALVQVIDVNRSTLVLYGAESKEDILAGLDQLLGEEAFDVFRKQLVALAAGHTRFEAESTNQTLAGDVMHISLRLSIPPGHEDTWSKVLISIADTTERKQAEKGQRQALAETLRATRALEESQRTLTTLMENLPGMAYRCRNDRHWTMEFISQGCLALTGYQSADLLHNRTLSYAQLIHPDDREMVWDVIQAAVEAEEPFQLVYRIITASGEEKWVWEQGTGVLSPAGDVALEGFITDITERKQAEERAQRLLEQQTAVNQLALTVGETRNLTSVYSTIYEHIRAMVDVWGFTVSFYHEHTHLIEAGYAVHKGITVDATGIPPVPLAEPGRGVQSQVIHSGEPLYTSDDRQALGMSRTEHVVMEDGTVTQGPPSEKEESTRSALYVPMKIEGKTIGVMQLQSPHLDAYTREDIDLLTAMANAAAVAIQNARLYEALQGELGERVQAEEGLKEHSERLEDIVERRTAELQQSKEKARAQYKGIPVPTYTWQKAGEDTLLVDYNDAAETITQGKIAGFVGIELGEMHRDSPEIREAIAQCFAERTTIQQEMRYRFQSTGGEKPLAVKYAFVPPDLVLVHTEDITERVRAEEELRKHAAELKRLVNLMAGREVRMAELKQVIRKLQAQLEEAGLEPVADDPLLQEGA